MSNTQHYPTPQERGEREHEERKQQILDAVEELLVEEGIEKLSIRSIARRISYAPASLYHYYKDKDAIIAAVLARTGRRIGAAIAAAARETADPIEALRRAFASYVAVALEKPALARLVYLMRRPLSGNIRPGATERNPNLALLADLLAQGHEAGVMKVDDVDTTVRCLWTAAQGLVIRLAIDELSPGPERDRLVDRYFGILIDGLKTMENDSQGDSK